MKSKLLTKNLAEALKPNIRVNAVAPFITGSVLVVDGGYR